MFKSSFSKYLTAFVIIIFVSFIMLASIITSMIRGFVSDETEEKLILANSIITKDIEENQLLTGNVVSSQLSMVIEPIVNFDTKFDVLITNTEGKILLKTFGESALNPDGTKQTVINVYEGLGFIDLSEFETVTGDRGDSNLVYRGDFDGLLPETSLVCASAVVINGAVKGYVMSLASTISEDRLVSITRSAVINSSIWVMLAAVIAVYFITERIIHPLRTMTNASKEFAKGNFSARVTVYGKDEVAELGNSFNNMAESLDSLEKMRNSFLANISHDLRTPMTTIAGFIDGINSGAIPPEKHEYYLGVISAEVHRLSRLVSQILDVSRLESGERKFNFTDFDVAEMARIILISFEQKIDDKQLDVQFAADSDDMFVNADKDAIYQVLYNLCHNAIKFSCEKGKFIISISRIQGKKIRVSVYDEGQSISKEDSKLIFDRFYKTDKSRGLDKNGVGLGLYISKTIIDAHQEDIGVEAGEDFCEFWFTLKEGNTVSKRNIK